MSKIIDFYANDKENTEGMTLIDYWFWNDNEMEKCHNQMQWLFPLNTTSAYNLNAPILTENDIRLFRSHMLLQKNLLISFRKWMKFCGLQYKKGIIIVDNVNRFHKIIKYPNHNLLRITRVLLSLHLLGLSVTCHNYFKFLEFTYKDGIVNEEAFGYWKDAEQGINRRLIS